MLNTFIKKIFQQVHNIVIYWPQKNMKNLHNVWENIFCISFGRFQEKQIFVVNGSSEEKNCGVKLLASRPRTL